MDDRSQELSLRPIGWVSSPFVERSEAPRQPRVAKDAQATITLRDGPEMLDALGDIERWDYLWILFWFHRNESWRPRVRPPRSRTKRGVFATRSPHRPNPLGISVVRLVRVEGRTLHIEEVDLLDGTPVLDLKPYVAWSDSIPDAGDGWLTDERPDDPQPDWSVGWTDAALERLAWLAERDVDLKSPVQASLSVGPHAHAYRRIRKDGDAMRLSVKQWRVRFRFEERRIEVLSIHTGYRPREIHGDNNPSLDLHRAFVARFGF